MSSSMKVTGLGIDDDAFLISSLIDRCPRVMMLRELVQNAIEAATCATGKKLVDIGVADIDGARKLRIWNTGPGMDADKLYRMCDLASSIGKIKGLDGNFGMGAKVACLPSNHLGVRYRSACQGRAYEVTLGKRDGIYGRLMRAPSGRASRPGTRRLTDIVDVTDEVVRSGISLEEDWTEVVLMGMAPEQDTSTDPYGGDPAVEAYWLPEALYRRYFDISPDVALTIDPELHWLSDRRRFEPVKRRATTRFAGYEAVACDGGITLHYLYDPEHPERPWENLSSEGALQSSTSFVAVVWRNEMYEVQRDSAWYYDAPKYGFTFGGRHLSVLIELADDYPVLPDAYRQFLWYRNGAQAQVRPKDFAPLVRQHRPDWVRKIANLGKEGGSLGAGIIANLATLAGDLRLERLGAAKEGGGWAAAASGAGEPGEFRDAIGACGFEPVLLRDATEVRDRWLEGRAACFYPETNQLFVNMRYGSLERFASCLLKEVAGPQDEPALASSAREVAELLFVERLMRAVLFGIAKHLDQEHWQEGHVEKALSPETLSIVADDLDSLLPQAMEALRERAMLSSPSPSQPVPAG